MVNLNRLLGVVASGFVAALVLPSIAFAANSTTVVYPGNTDGWTFFNDQTNTPEASPTWGSYVEGPADPPAGDGSVQLVTDDGSDGYLFSKEAFGGTRIADLTSLTYSTYVQTGNGTIAPSLQLNIDPDVVTEGVTETGYYGRLVYEPYQTGPADTVTEDNWQTWDTLSGTAQWWLTNSAARNTANVNDNATNPCPQENPCTLAELLAAYPNIGINENEFTVGEQTYSFAMVGFKAGSGWSVPFTGNVDNLMIGTLDNVVTYDFEADAPAPTNKEQCKNDGWRNGDFKNQGECVSSFTRNENANKSSSSGLVDRIRNLFR
jgi:hypothetical protein